MRWPGVLDRPLDFSIWWVILGLPVLIFLGFLSSRPFRHAVVAPWRSLRTALPFLAGVILLGFTLFPWDSAEMPFYNTGSRYVFCMVLAGSGLVLVLAGAFRQLRFLDPAIPRIWRRVCSLNSPVFMLLVFGLMLLAANLVSWLGYQHIPHVSDSAAQLFQARVFATGHSFLPTPQFAGFFDRVGIISNGRWFSQYPFLHSLVLVPGVLAGIPWLVNPLLGALAAAAIYLLGREVYDERTGRLAALLACLSPFVVTMSAEFMNHATALVLATLFLLFWFRYRRQRRWHRALLAGVFVGLVACVRPYTGLALALPFGGLMLFRAIRNRGSRVTGLLLFMAGAAALASLSLIYNRLTTGDPMLFGYIVKRGVGHMVGFHQDPTGISHTLWRGLLNTGNELNLLNLSLFEWGLPSLLPLALLLAIPRLNRQDRLLLAAFGILIVAYVFYWAHGARFYYAAFGALLVLSARGMLSVGRFARRTLGLRVDDDFGNKFLARTLPVLLLFMVAVGLPPVLKQCRNQSYVDARSVMAIRSQGICNAVIFSRRIADTFFANRFRFPEGWSPTDAPPSPDRVVSGDIVHARDFGYLNPALTLAYPGREYYRVKGDSLQRLEGMEFEGSALQVTLTELARFLTRTRVDEYRTVLWPFPEVLPASRNTAHLGYRGVSDAIFSRERDLDTYLPALACWLRYDRRAHLGIFNPMSDAADFRAGKYRFTLLYATPDSLGLVYDIRVLN
jgi:hypothetical protein